MTFEWDQLKKAANPANPANPANLAKHRISFEDAQGAFLDERRIILKDEKHSSDEERFFCIGRTSSGIVTVRFCIRNGNIRIFGAG